MRIVRYELEIVDYQQVQPLWPGRILAIKPGRLQQVPYRRSTGENLSGQRGVTLDPGDEVVWETAQKIDMWCVDDTGNQADDCNKYQDPREPILGVWIVGTGNPMPDEIAARGMLDGFPDTGLHGYEIPVEERIDYRDTCVMANRLVWHVFTSVIGHVQPVETGYGEVSSADDILDTVAERRRKELQRVADMERENYA